jgi:hypothetical protein
MHKGLLIRQRPGGRLANEEGDRIQPWTLKSLAPESSQQQWQQQQCTLLQLLVLGCNKFWDKLSEAK